MMNMLPAYGYEAPATHAYFPHYAYNMNMAAYSSPIPSYAFPVKSESSDDSSPTSRTKQFDNPEEASRYREKRTRNNQAAQRSRKVRKQREQEAVTKANSLEQENKQLKEEIRLLRQQNDLFKQQLQSSLCNRCSGFLVDSNHFSASATQTQSIQLAAQLLRKPVDCPAESVIRVDSEEETGMDERDKPPPFMETFIHPWTLI